MFPREEVPDKFIRDVLTEVEGMRKIYLKDGKAVYDKAVAKHIREWREHHKLDKKALAEATRKRAELRVDVDKKGAFHAMLHRLSGGAVGAGERASIYAKGEVIRHRYLARWDRGVTELNAASVVKNGTLDKEIMMEMHAIGTTGKGGVSGSKLAEDLARLYRGLNDEMHADMRRYGMRAGYLDDFIISQSHSADKIREAGYKNWRKFLDDNDLIDKDRTFTGELKGNKGRQEKYLEDVYKKLTTYGDRDNLGRELTPEGVLVITKRQLSTPKFSSRSLHFKDGEKFFLYNQMFGDKNLAESFQKSFRRSSQFQSFADVLGPDPEGAFNRFMEVHGRDMSTAQRVELENIWKNLTGKVNEGSDSMLAQGFAIGRAIMNAALLGKAVISALPDFAISISKMRTISGEGVFSTAHKLASDYFALATSKAERQTMGLLLEIQAEGILGATFSRLGVGGEGSSRLAADISRMTYKYNLLEPHTNISKWAFGVTLGAEMNIRLNTNYGDLPANFRNYLNSYNVTYKDWGAMQSLRASNPEILGNFNGKAFLAPGELRKFDPGLADKMSVLYGDSANIAVPTPGVRQKAAANAGLAAGTFTGQLWRSMLHLKSFPLTVLRSVDNIVRSAAPDGSQGSLRDALSTKEGAFAMAQLMGGATVLGGLALMAKDVASGKEPRDVLSGQGLLDSFIQGGAGGLYADLIFGAYDVQGRSLTSAMLGPTGALANDVANIFATARGSALSDDPKGKLSKAGKDAIKLAMRNVPGQNLFYLEAGLKYLVLDEINEGLNPGYKRRREKRMKKKEALFSDDGVDSL